ncbi:hypothetical protein HMPREF1575_00737 [Gardnerella vaginalis JCP7672]|nr:hypothetical protein HMPREF1575_00737 [Gardnerella vaginalis JCP7672]
MDWCSAPNCLFALRSKRKGRSERTAISSRSADLRKFCVKNDACFCVKILI